METFCIELRFKTIVSRDVRLSINPMRFVVVHYHIFKNGGSTVLSILERSFQGRFAAVHGREDGCSLDGTCLAEFLSTNREVRALSSHHIRYPKPEMPGTVIFDVCFLRHPLERMYSIYSYFRMIETDDALSRRARQEGPREFLRTLMNDAPHIASNPQTTLLANGGVFTRPADRMDFDRACEVIREMALPGIVERFDESLVAAEYFLKPAFPDLSLEYVPQNVSRPLGGGSAQRLARVRSILGPELYDDLLRLNQFDLELFHRAAREVMRRFVLVPNAEQRLEQFRSRCAALPGAADREERVA